MGKVATVGLTATRGPMNVLLEHDDLSCIFCDQIPIIPIYHPAYLLRRLGGGRCGFKGLGSTPPDLHAGIGLVEAQPVRAFEGQDDLGKVIGRAKKLHLVVANSDPDRLPRSQVGGFIP